MVNEYSQITIEVFLTMAGALPFDVYIRLGDSKFMRIFKKGDAADPARFKTYAEKGVDSLFIQRKDRREYIAATEKLFRAMVAKSDITAVEASQAMQEFTEQTLYEIYEDKIFDEQSLRWAQEIVRSFVGLLKADVKLLTSFIHLSRNETYMCRHGIATSIIAVLIARAAENTNDRMLQIVGLGGLLHDVGMSKLPTALWEMERRLTDQEWIEIKRHPTLGSEMVMEVKGFPDDVKTVIEQHHEAHDGSGYPRRIRGEEIYYPARIIALADAFSALTTRRAGRSLYRPEDALAQLNTERHRYDPKLLAAFENLLAPRKKKAS